ncbi:MAG: hypothetical protein UE970_04845, partial [Catenibacillus sp.]|nr:hypothetical protein [Catenibacillus sp.]
MKKGLVKAAVVGAAIVIIAGLTAVVISVKSSRQRQAEVAKGVEVIRNMETVDATQIENKIRQMEEDELKNTEEYKN